MAVFAPLFVVVVGLILTGPEAEAWRLHRIGAYDRIPRREWLYVQDLLESLLRSEGNHNRVFPMKIINAEKEVVDGFKYKVTYTAIDGELCSIHFTVPIRPMAPSINAFRCYNPEQIFDEN